ncbi:MAG: hypothetical protein ACP5JB_02420 [candidate division WOR-3 bacterium]|jgi:hypothetical protein
MRFNWVDVLAIGAVASVAAVQLLRATRDFSQVFYETVFMVLAVVGAVRFFIPVSQRLNLNPALALGMLFVLLLVLGLLFATFINQGLGFSLGGFDYLFGLLLGIVCGFVFGHALLRTIMLATMERHAEVVAAVRRSWMASQVLYFGAFRELLGILRIARYNNI